MGLYFLEYGAVDPSFNDGIFVISHRSPWGRRGQGLFLDGDMPSDIKVRWRNVEALSSPRCIGMGRLRARMEPAISVLVEEG